MRKKYRGLANVLLINVSVINALLLMADVLGFGGAWADLSSTQAPPNSPKHHLNERRLEGVDRVLFITNLPRSAITGLIVFKLLFVVSKSTPRLVPGSI